MSQMIVRCPLDKLELTDQHGFIEPVDFVDQKQDLPEILTASER